MSERNRNLIALAVCLGAPLAAGFIGAAPTISAVPTWYRQIEKPSWNPPAWIFGPVWTTLYLMMGSAMWLVWRRGWENREVRAAAWLFGVQLGLNAAWSLIFFGLRSPGAALAEIVPLWGMIVATTRQFFQVRPVAGLLMLPYLLWTTFATGLNAAVWWLNRG